MAGGGRHPPPLPAHRVFEAHGGAWAFMNHITWFLKLRTTSCGSLERVRPSIPHPIGFTTPRFNTARFLEMGVFAPTRARGLRLVGKVG